MSIRKRKKQVASHLFMCMLGRHLENWLNTPDEAEKKLMADGHAARCKLLDASETHPWPPKAPVNGEINTSAVFVTDGKDVFIEQAKVEYVVQRVKDGVVVDTFDNRDEAAQLIMKHARQKKAKLTLVPGEGVVPFTLEELQAWA